MDKTHAESLSFPRMRQSSLTEQAWLEVAKQRLDDILSKKVKTIPDDVVFERIHKRLGQ